MKKLIIALGIGALFLITSGATAIAVSSQTSPTPQLLPSSGGGFCIPFYIDLHVEGKLAKEPYEAGIFIKRTALKFEEVTYDDLAIRLFGSIFPSWFPSEYTKSDITFFAKSWIITEYEYPYIKATATTAI